MDSDSLNKVSQMVFYYISTASRMTKIFQEWCMLDDNERQSVDKMVLALLDLEHTDLYKAIREALIRWEIVQDTEGASGFHECTAIEHSFTEEMDTLVLKIIRSLELAVLEVNACKYGDAEIGRVEDEVRGADTAITFRQHIGQLCKTKRDLSTNSDEELASDGAIKEKQRMDVEDMRKTKSNSDLVTSPPRKLKRNLKNSGRQVELRVRTDVCAHAEYDTE